MKYNTWYYSTVNWQATGHIFWRETNLSATSEKQLVTGNHKLSFSKLCLKLSSKTWPCNFRLRGVLAGCHGLNEFSALSSVPNRAQQSAGIPDAKITERLLCLKRHRVLQVDVLTFEQKTTGNFLLTQFPPPFGLQVPGVPAKSSATRLLRGSSSACQKTAKFWSCEFLILKANWVSLQQTLRDYKVFSQSIIL